MSTAQENLAKAKAQLILEHPFHAALMVNLPLIERTDLPTMAVDGKNIYYNPEFVAELTVPEVKFVMAHEVMHCVYSHMTRRGSRDHKKWNVAGDYIINHDLVTDRVGKMPDGALYDAALYQAAKGLTDTLYNLLPDGAGGEGPGTPGGSLDDVLDADGDAEQQEQDWKVRVVQAAQAAKMVGNLTANQQRLVDQIVKPQVPWAEVLLRFISAKARVDRSFSKPNRRFISHGLYLPAMAGERLGHIGVAVDCSGSIGQKELNLFAAEMQAIKDTTKPEKLTVMYFDSSVSHVDTFEREDDLHVEPHGGGGTAFSPVIKAFSDLDEPPVAVVFLTDLYCNDFGPAPEFPVLWVSNGADEAPWGEVTKLIN